jgi:hypothetical protein
MMLELEQDLPYKEIGDRRAHRRADIFKNQRRQVWDERSLQQQREVLPRHFSVGVNPLFMAAITEEAHVAVVIAAVPALRLRQVAPVE